MELFYPYSDFISAMKEKDAELFGKLGRLSPAEFWREWKKTYPEDFPQGGMSLPLRSSIVSRPRTPTMTLAEWDIARAAFASR